LKKNAVKLLTLLKDNEFVSGTELSKALGVSRTTVNNYVSELRQFGVDVFSVKGKGYKVNHAIEFLDILDIGAAVKKLQPSFDLNNLHYTYTINSTNQFLIGDYSSNGKVAICMAEFQTAGRGRRGRAWQASFGADLTLSIKYPFNTSLQHLSGLSLAVGVAISNAIQRLFGIECQLKWPNDIYVHGKKLCGVLIEIVGDIHGTNNVVIGIGCNVLANKMLEQATTSISNESSIKVNRQHFTKKLIVDLLQTCIDFEHFGFESFVEPWNKLDYLKGKTIQVLGATQKELGVGQGIDDNGGYQYVNDENEVHVIYGGEISLRVQS
jgi:BirA family transcriptional regulator, biotin operon repressor / biotin---[acetyl-CoA-carboxylase] ligase